VTIEFVGAIEIDPPLNSNEDEQIRRLAEPLGGSPYGAPTPASPWLPDAKGTRLRVSGTAAPEDCADWLRYLIADTPMLDGQRLVGIVVGHDTDSGELVTIRAGGGRVTRRTLRRPVRARAPKRSNVIDLAARRRAIS
jgi:hypothetical protein